MLWISGVIYQNLFGVVEETIEPFEVLVFVRQDRAHLELGPLERVFRAQVADLESHDAVHGAQGQRGRLPAVERPEGECDRGAVPNGLRPGGYARKLSLVGMLAVFRARKRP